MSPLAFIQAMLELRVFYTRMWLTVRQYKNYCMAVPEIQVDSRSRAAYRLGIWLMVFPLWPQFPVWENSGPNVTDGKEHSLGARWNWISSSFWYLLAECLRKRLLPALQVPPRSLCRVVMRVGVTCLAHRCSGKRIFCRCPKHSAAAICLYVGWTFPLASWVFL